MRNTPAAWQDASLAKRFSVFTEEMHAYGSKVCAQLVAGSGRVGGKFPGSEGAPAACDIPNFWDPSDTHRGYTVDVIYYLVDCFGKSAAYVKRCGADAVELHAYGGYLLDQFMSSAWSHRTDEYGGNLGGRMRIMTEIIAAIKESCGNDFPIIAKFTPIQFFEGGRCVEEGIEMAKILESADVHALHVDAGSYETWYTMIPPSFGDYKQCSNLHVRYADIIKKK